MTKQSTKTPCWTKKTPCAIQRRSPHVVAFSLCFASTKRTDSILCVSTSIMLLFSGVLGRGRAIKGVRGCDMPCGGLANNGL